MKKTGIIPILLLTGLFLAGAPAPGWGGGSDLVIDGTKKDDLTTELTTISPRGHVVARGRYIATAHRQVRQDNQPFLTYLLDLLRNLWGGMPRSISPTQR